MAKDLRSKIEIKEGDHLIPEEKAVQYLIETGISGEKAREGIRQVAGLREKFLACKSQKEIFKLINSI